MAFLHPQSESGAGLAGAALSNRCPRPPGGEVLDQYLDGVKNLPPTPTLMIKLIELFRRPDRDADEIVQLVRRDPALAAEVLRRCNNSFFESDTHVMDIDEAVFRLGFYEVYRITISLFGMKSLALKDPRLNFPVELLRKHSVVTALTAGGVAQAVGESEGIAFTAGLLHDVGKIVFAVAEGPHYGQLLQAHGHYGASLAAAEIAAFGFDHGRMGSRLLSRWGVPDEVALPVQEHHHSVSPKTFDKMAAILYLANLLAHHIQSEKPANFSELIAAGPAMEFLHFSPEQVTAVETLVRTKLKELPSLEMA